MVPMQENPELEHYMGELRRLLPELAEKYHVRTLEVFGSYVRNEQNAESDFDVLVTFEEAPSLLTFIELEYYLSDCLGLKVHLGMKDSLRPRIKQSVLQEAIPV